MERKLLKLIALFILVTLLTISVPLFIEGQITIRNPLAYDSFEGLINALINFVFTLALAISPIMIIIAGFHYVTSEGKPDKIELAKKIILYTLIGLLIIISARGLIGVFDYIFQRSSSIPSMLTYSSNFINSNLRIIL